MINFDDINTIPYSEKDISLLLLPELKESLPKSKIELSSYIECFKDYFDSERHIYDYYSYLYDDEYILGYHCARILNYEDYLKNGIDNDGGDDSIQEKRITNLLKNLDFDDEIISDILIKVHANWEINKQTKTKPVSFYLSKNYILLDGRGTSNYFHNIGGEILKWAIDSFGTNVWNQEPYIKLKTYGTPSIVTFKVKIKDLFDSFKTDCIKNIFILNALKYTGIMVNNLDSNKFNICLMTKEKVLPDNIINIEET